jgi:hypothetical protein
VEKYTFDNQQLDGSLTLNYLDLQGSDNGSWLGGLLSGADSCFSAYVDARGAADGCDYEMPMIVSGCLVSQGIQGFQLGLIMKSQTGDNCDQLISVGQMRVIVEHDGIAEKASGIGGGRGPGGGPGPGGNGSRL